MKTMRLLACLALCSYMPTTPTTLDSHPDSGYGLTTVPALWDIAETYKNTALATLGMGFLGATVATYQEPAAAFKLGASAMLASGSAWLWTNAQAPKRYWWTDNDGWQILKEQRRLQPENLYFPKNFMFGTGVSSYQVEGVGPNNGGIDTSTYAQSSPESSVGLACDQWNLYEHDAKLMQEKGLTTYRFSVERFKVEPEDGIYNQDALDHYATMARTLVQHYVRPLVGMHHYTDPQWFMDAGGFENETNLDGFARYCARVTGTIYQACMEEINTDFENKKHLIPLFYTYNSPNAYAAQSYLQGIRPPYVRSIQKFTNVLGNMLEAHVRAYHAMKQAMHDKNMGELSKIGTTINLYQLEPATYLNPIHRLKCFFANHIMHDSVFNFFKDGVFKLWVPTKAYGYKKNEDAPKSLDWIGLNYYSHGYMDMLSGPYNHPDTSPLELTGKEHHPIYAEGLFSALHQINDHIARPLGIPIIITETGIAEDAQDPEKRTRFLERYLYAASRACLAGIPLEGIMIWSFMDNYEWGTYDKQYGLFAVDFSSPERRRTWRPGAQYYADVISSSKSLPRAITLR